jgi:hypothetical protein
LQDGTDIDSGEELKTHVQTAELYVELFHSVDIGMAISKFKKGKATGHDQILAKLIKEGGRLLKKVIYEILKIWQEEIIPRVEMWHNNMQFIRKGTA